MVFATNISFVPYKIKFDKIFIGNFDTTNTFGSRLQDNSFLLLSDLNFSLYSDLFSLSLMTSCYFVTQYSSKVVYLLPFDVVFTRGGLVGLVRVKSRYITGEPSLLE